MDEKYFNKKIDSILDCFTLWLLNEYCITDAEEDKAKAILHQIAADARREALRDAVAAAVKLDEKYFKENEIVICGIIKDESYKPGSLQGILHQIARDGAEAQKDKLSKGLFAVESLMNESCGVYGLHLNGDVAPWDELRTGGLFEDWLIEFDKAINTATVKEVPGE